jgi:hypothetical protein
MTFSPSESNLQGGALRAPALVSSAGCSQARHQHMNKAFDDGAAYTQHKLFGWVMILLYRLLVAMGSYLIGKSRTNQGVRPEVGTSYTGVAAAVAAACGPDSVQIHNRPCATHVGYTGTHDLGLLQAVAWAAASLAS